MARFTVQGTSGQTAGCYVVDTSGSAPTVVIQSDFTSCTNLAALLNENVQSTVDPHCRCVSDANLNLATTGLTAIDGVTPVAGDRVLVANQSTASQNGVYIASSGAWSLAPDYVQGAVRSAMVFEVSEGTVYANTSWKITAAQASSGGFITVGTTDPAFYPKTLKGTTAAMTAGSTGSISSHIWLLTGGVVMATANTAGGTAGTLKCTTRSAGKAGTGAITIQSSSGADTATVDYCIVNW